MRWDNLRIDGQEAARLPGYRDEAVVRRFDAPEALDTRFYEVGARSVLNRVPKSSRMPFPWTINPYRGCTHACTYCVAGDTPILMADGRTRPLAELRAGDLIYGTARSGSYRRYVETQVLAQWSTVKPAYRVTLEDGTELVASADHRFLSDRGWKHVQGAEQGRLRRPHLTTTNKLMGTGGFAAAPPDSSDYRRGYLCGLIRADGHIGSYSYERPGRPHGDVHRFRLALTDLEALRRARGYLAGVGVATDEFLFQAGAAPHRAVTAIRTQAPDRVLAVKELIGWPRTASADWRKGFLAGSFDAEGSSGSGILRICNTDRVIIDWVAWCLRGLGFDCAIEPARGSDGLTYVRVRGGLAERLRFLHTVDPAITRKRTITGTALKSQAHVGVVSIEPLAVELPMHDITTGTGDFIANGVVSHNCFARPTHTYLGFDVGRDFEREIVVKVNAPEVVRRELRRPSWKREHVAMGTNTDPYQWVERRYQLMPPIWEALAESATPCSILTKSPLLLRDLDVLKAVAERVPVSANFSVPTLDEGAWRATEPHTPSPRARLDAVAKLNAAGIPTGVLVAPLMPGINDDPDQVERILALATEAGAVSVGGIALHLRGEVRDLFFDWLRAQRPDLVPRYEQLYRRGAYASPDERRRLAALVRRDGEAGRRYLRQSAPTRPAPAENGRGQPSPPAAPEQASLF